MILFRRVVIFVVIGLIISTFALMYQSSSATILGPSFLSITGHDNQGFSLCPDVAVDRIGYVRGWPYGVAENSLYDSPEDYTISECQGQQDEFYPASYFANVLIFASVSALVFLIVKEFKKKGVKNG